MIIIARAKNRELPEGTYFERHHVIPKCCGGEDKDYNIVKLLPQEHYEAHRELSLANPENIQLGFAWFGMCTGNPWQKSVREIIYSAEDYAKAKIYSREIALGGDGNRDKQLENWKDEKFRKDHLPIIIKTLLSPEVKEKSRINSKKYREEHKEEISKKSKTQMIEQWKDPEYRKMQSKRHTGKQCEYLWKKVRYIPTGEVFESIAAAINSGINDKSNIHRHLRGIPKKINWEYIE